MIDADPQGLIDAPVYINLMAHILLTKSEVKNVSVSYQVGSAKYPDTIREKFKANCSNFIRDGYNINLVEKSMGDYTFLNVKIEEGAARRRNSGVLFKWCNQKLAEILTDLILENWEHRLVYKIIKNQYYYFNRDERKEVLIRALEMLGDPSDERELSRRGQDVLQQIEKYLGQSKEINMEGFINFRLKDYRRVLEDAVDKAVDDYLMEKEYDEFIQLLQYFVDIQDPRIDTVNVVLKKSGLFELFDGKNEPIDNNYLEGFILDMTDNEINYEDLLISALITIAPRRVVLHASKNPGLYETVKTIKNVFGGRVQECTGCQICRNQGQRKR